jgi:hypothetical protein
VTPDDLQALRAYAERRRADLTATRLGAARQRLTTAGLVRDCAARESPMYVTVTIRGHEVLAEALKPVQLDLFGGAQ